MNLATKKALTTLAQTTSSADSAPAIYVLERELDIAAHQRTFLLDVCEALQWYVDNDAGRGLNDSNDGLEHKFRAEALLGALHKVAPTLPDDSQGDDQHHHTVQFRPNQLTRGNNVFEMSPAYCRGAQAVRNSTPYTDNPYLNTGSQAHIDWCNGHANESQGEHIRFGIDVITAPGEGRRFEEDHNTPRDSANRVDLTWYAKRRRELLNLDTFGAMTGYAAD